MKAVAGAVLVVALSVLLAVADGNAQTGLPDVDIVLIVEISDVNGWAALHQEHLGTADGVGKPLRVALPAGTGGNRGITIEQPKLTVSIVAPDPRRVVKIGVTGRIRAAEALASLTNFELAALEVQAGSTPNNLTILYGLSAINAQLLELHLGRP